MEQNNNDVNKSNGGYEICVSDSKDDNFFDFSSKKSLAERRGFNKNAAKINTSFVRFGATTTIPFTIPSGISPTALLESPIMLPNSQALPSPTTGTFAVLPALSDEGQGLTSVTHEQGNINVPISSDIAASFTFKQYQSNLDADALSPIFASLNQISSNSNMNGEHRDNQMLAQDQPLLDFSFPEDFQFYNDEKMIDDVMADINNVELLMARSEEATDESTLPENSVHGEDNGRQTVAEPEQKDVSQPTGGMVRTSEDGYNWRKYGQKQVKGSEYPRSYYKCTQSNCQVKKKVERSHDGHITEIIYKGNHNHVKPHSSRRTSVPSNDEMSETAEANETSDRVDIDTVWGNIQLRAKDAKYNPDGQPEGQERTSSPSVVTDVSDTAKRARAAGMFESDDAPEHSSSFANHDGDKDGATRAVLPVEDIAEEADSESRKRRKESYTVETMVSSRANREPRVVVQIESEIDILDDGYRWRKYGQKVVKGNPNPRSYYKCTSAGCTVRKHVERASQNLKFVLTTYEGKHNHDIPTARNNNHISSTDAGLHSSGANMSLTLPGSSGIPKSETLHTLGSYFDIKPDLSNDFMRSSFMGSFSNDLNYCPSSMSQMKYSSLNNIIPYGSYGTTANHGAMPQHGPTFPEFSMPLPLNFPSSGNYSLTGLNFNYANPTSSVQSYLSGQQMKDIDAGFIRPKQELKDESFYAPCPPSLDHASSSFTPPSASQSDSIYQNVMQNFSS